jgi:hypothetical protein
MLGNIEFIASLAYLSPKLQQQSLKKLVTTPNIELLLRLMLNGSAKTKLLILRIFQAILKLDIPMEILDKAVEACEKADEETGP